MTLKVHVSILLVISALFFPFWVTATLFLLGSIFFERFYFGLGSMFLIDLLYGFTTLKLFGMYGALFFASLLVFFLIQLIKSFMNIQTVP